MNPDPLPAEIPEIHQDHLQIHKHLIEIAACFADRVIVATARRHAIVAITADKKILAYPHVDVPWERET